MDYNLADISRENGADSLYNKHAPSPNKGIIWDVSSRQRRRRLIVIVWFPPPGKKSSTRQHKISSNFDACLS